MESRTGVSLDYDREKQRGPSFWGPHTASTGSRSPERGYNVSLLDVVCTEPMTLCINDNIKSRQIIVSFSWFISMSNHSKTSMWRSSSYFFIKIQQDIWCPLDTEFLRCSHRLAFQSSTVFQPRDAVTRHRSASAPQLSLSSVAQLTLSIGMRKANNCRHGRCVDLLDGIY